jgi:hypothetical protein
MGKYDIRPSYSSIVAKIGRGLAWILGVAVFLAMIIGLVWKGRTGCEGDPDRARAVLEGAGYTDIEIGGANGWRCGENDGESNSFTALGPTKKYVEGVVCCSRNGCSKGCTIRMEP